MKTTNAHGLDGRLARRLLARARPERSLAGRIDVLSALLLGTRYRANGLVGSAESPEVLTASLEGFDCVTYVETVLALARSSRAEELTDELRRMRYDGGRVDWARRNHYMTGWIRANARAGAVRSLSAGALATRKERLLDAVPGLPPKRTRFACVPKSKLARLEPRLATGDLVFFASTRPSLDVFHCGFLVRDGETLKLRHASRSRGSVVEEELSGFLRSNRMAGVLVARPLERGAGHRSLSRPPSRARTAPRSRPAATPARKAAS